jgi:hypothetical protein
MTSHKKPKRQTAQEFMEQLERDPAYLELRRKQEQRRQDQEALYRRDEAALVAALAAVGVKVGSVWDLVNQSGSYPEAIPVLQAFLSERSLLPATREGIVRALTVTEARGVVGHDLLRELRRSTSDAEMEFRWAIANALTVVSEPGMIDEVESLARDEKYKALRRELKATVRRLRRGLLPD